MRRRAQDGHSELRHAVVKCSKYIGLRHDCSTARRVLIKTKSKFPMHTALCSCMTAQSGAARVGIICEDDTVANSSRSLKVAGFGFSCAGVYS